MQLMDVSMKYTRAIVRTPGKSMVHGLTTSNTGPPDYELALSQHEGYIRALEDCGLEVYVLEANEGYPDSTFIEDVALLTERCAIITNPGAPTRRGETEGMPEVLGGYYSAIERIQDPGTVEAGDVLMVGTHFYVGISQRTNEYGAAQLISLLEKFGMTGSTVKLKDMLHLKSGIAYLEHNNLVACGEFINRDEFRSFHIMEIETEECYAANCIWVNDTVLISAGYPKARAKIERAGYPVREVDVSEFRKLDGGLSCLSLRF